MLTDTAVMRQRVAAIAESISRSLGLALLFALVSIAGAAAQGAPERSEITIGIGPDWAAGGHAVLALQKGYFKEEGLTKVNLRSFQAGQLQLEAMASDSVDFANPAQGPVLTLRGNGLPIVVLASTTITDGAIGVAILKSAQVTNPKQLEGLKIGVLKGTSAEHMLLLLAKHYGLDPSKIQMVNLPPPAQLASLSTGAIDGVAVWQPWLYLAGKKVDSDIVHTGTVSGFRSNRGEKVRIDHTRNLLVASEQFVRTNPSTVAAVLRAYAKAQQFVSNPRNFDEWVAVFSSYHKQDAEVNKTIFTQFTSTLALDGAYFADMNAMAEFLTSTGRLRNKVSLSDLTYSAPLAKINASLVQAAPK